jgi:multidrug efflux pump subunit AcrA (membrane-fusion protein)
VSSFRNWVPYVAGILVVVVAAGIGLAKMGWFPFRKGNGAAGHGAAAQHAAAEPSDDEDEGGARPIPIKAIQPRLDPSFTTTVTVPAYVEPYFRADLQARVAGPVKYVGRALGEFVREGEVLVIIDVPDLEEAVAQKDELIRQREIDVDLARAKASAAEASVSVAQKLIGVKDADVEKASATQFLREKELARFQRLSKETAVTPDVVEEAEFNLKSAKAGVKSAKANVEKATADAKEAEANFLAAKADISVKENLVRVAVKERAQAQAQLELAVVRSPFDGRVVECNVNVGSFVQNATTARSQPMLSIARMDMVTVYARLPDDYADLMNAEASVSVQIDKRPGLLIQGKLSRFAPFIEKGDRTMRVEVDFYNAPERLYERYMARTVAAQLAPLAGGNLPGLVTLAGASRIQWKEQTKGRLDPFPIFPDVKGSRITERGYALMPGMYGRMRLTLQNFSGAYLLPSSAVFTRGGKRYIMEVVDEVVHVIPVRVQFDDGNVVKVDRIKEVPLPKGGRQEILEPLHGDEEIVLSGQGEVEEGRSVITTFVPHW